MEVTFVTTNKAKLEQAREYGKKYGIKIKNRKLELYEKQDKDVRQVVSSKALYALSRINAPLFVDDRGFSLPALNGFPGALVKFVLYDVGVDGIMKLMDGKKDRRAEFKSSLAFIEPGMKKPKIFTSEEHGFVVDGVRDGNKRGWTDLMNIYGYEKYMPRAVSELNEDEWKTYQKDVGRGGNIENFMRWLSRR